MGVAMPDPLPTRCASPRLLLKMTAFAFADGSSGGRYTTICDRRFVLVDFRRRLGGIGDDAFEFGDVFEESFSTRAGEAADRLRTIAAGAFFDFEQAGLFEQLKLPRKIAVGQRAQVLEIVEGEPGLV